MSVFNKKIEILKGFREKEIHTKFIEYIPRSRTNPYVWQLIISTKPSIIEDVFVIR